MAQVYERRIEHGIVGGWFGDADPTELDMAVALTWQTWPNITGDALYAIGPTDAERMPWLDKPTGEWVCNGTTVTTWN